MIEMVRGFFEKQCYSRNIGLFISQDRNDGRRFFPKVVRWVEVPDNQAAQPEEAFRVTYTAAQEMMDGLWSCGIRPTEGAGSAGAMTATQKHLEDMRRLVFEKQDSGYKPKGGEDGR